MKFLKPLTLLSLLLTVAMMRGQNTSQNGGSIQGVITDPSGAAVPGAQVLVSNPATGLEQALVTDKAGFYSAGPLTPGAYKVSVSHAGFQTLNVETVIRTGTATPGSFKLPLGASTETVDVDAGAIQINTDQISLSDVITKQQIDTLPINGRNFLDLAQIEPGVILQSGESFDPTKAGYSAISVGGVSGRTTRILLDGQDITDETVGTTIFNVSQGAIGEFQLNRSTQDVSGEVTSQGQLLVSTNSGTNAYHGQAFYNFQDDRALFAPYRGILSPFQRNQYGGSVGGPVIKDKLFFFGNSERIQQKSLSTTPVTTTANGGLFGNIAAAYPSIPAPFHDTYSTVRLDFNGPLKGHYFVRGAYEVNTGTSNFGDGYWLYANRDNTPAIVGGADFVFGKFTHSFRYGYEKFHNLISDATAGNSSIYNGIPGFAFYNSSQGLFSGPNYLAPQGTFQSDKQARYDGSWTKGAHNLRFGYALNRIQGGGYAAFFGLSPRASERSSSAFTGPTATNPMALGCKGVAGAAPCTGDPINGYHVYSMYIGNGQGFFTENPGFGLIGGGTADWRESAYVTDSWKLLPSLTLTAGVRWSTDTGRANQDLAAPTCGDVDTTQVNSPCGTSPATTSLQSIWNPILVGKVHQPYGNFGPQAGLNFSPGNHKTSIRLSGGIFYESDVFNNTTNARTNVIRQGAFFDDRSLCAGTYKFTAPDGSVITTTPNGTLISDACNNQSIATAAPQLIALQQQYQTLTKAHALSQNASFIGNTLYAGGAYGAAYRTPYSEQVSGGISRELFKGATLGVDYVHNATLKISQSVDQNHIGAARYLNAAAARNAIVSLVTPNPKTNYAGYPTCPQNSSAAAINCALAQGATIDDFANHGLDSGNVYLGGYPVSYATGDLTQTPATGAAFPGANPLLGNGSFLLPIGKTGYDALQVVYRSQQSHPLPGFVSTNLQAAYTLSRIVSSSGGSSDAFFSSGSIDNDNPNAYMGRASLDHTNEFTFGGYARMKYGPVITLTGQVFSAPSESLTLDTGDPTGDIFRTDITGDGTTGDLAPGTLQGDYGHKIRSKDLAGYINNFNATKAGTLTPAGQALVASGVFTQQQLVASGATIQQIATPSATSAFSFPRFVNVNASFSYPIPLGHYIGRESVTLEPGIAFYNALNTANYGSAIASGSLLNTTTTGGATNTQTGYLTGDNSSTLNSGRTQRGSGTFDAGGPRSTEFQLKLNF